jgi:hypothetical protein
LVSEVADQGDSGLGKCGVHELIAANAFWSQMGSVIDFDSGHRATGVDVDYQKVDMFLRDALERRRAL